MADLYLAFELEISFHETCGLILACHGRLARSRERSSSSVHSHALGGYKFQNLDHLTTTKDVTSRLSESKVYAKRHVLSLDTNI